MSKLPAQQIPVTAARLTLLWPLALQLGAPAAHGRETADAVAKQAAAIEALPGQWQRVSDLAEHIPRPGPEDDIATRRWENEVYAEGVYFHPFVQRFLFARQNAAGGDWPLWLFRRTDITALNISWGKDRSARLKVDRLNLYMFRTGAAVLVTELSTQADAALKLADIEDLHDILRRAYHPYATQWDGEAKKETPVRQASHLVLRGVTWIGENNAPIKDGAFDLADDLDAVPNYLARPNAKGLRQPPVFSHWLRLLNDALPLARPDSADEGDRWHHVVDERMPTLLTVSVTATDGTTAKDHWFRSIRPGDFVRLCFADGSNTDAATATDATDYPYNPAFLADFEKRHAYDRFAHWGTRYFVSGYSLVAIGAGDDFDGIVKMHMRRHYFQMALIAQMEVATLLSLSSAISRSAELFEDEGGALSEAARKKFRDRMQALNENFMQFAQRFRFTGVSNQMQATELFNMLRKALGLKRLFADVRAELESANTYLFADAQTKAGNASVKLSRVAAVGLVAAFAASFLGMNVVAKPELFCGLPGFLASTPARPDVWAPAGCNEPSIWGHVCLALIAGGVISGLGGWVMGRLLREPGGGEPRITRGLKIWGVVMVLLGFAMLAAAWIRVTVGGAP